MQYDEALKEIVRIMSKYTDRRRTVTRVEPTMRIMDDLGVYSLNFVEMILECEEQFHISISDDELGRIGTIGDCVDAVVAAQANAAARTAH